MSIQRSLFEQILIESADISRSVDITAGSVNIDYYEDVFSPTVTAKIRVINTGNTVVSPKSKDAQKQSIYNGLPLRGGERVALKIAGNSTTNPGLDFLTDNKDYLYVSSISDAVIENNRESFTLHLVSREAITNETTRVYGKYPTSLPIHESASSIISNILRTDKSITADKTSNTYGFIGNMRKPFTVLTWLASKGVPSVSENQNSSINAQGGTAGFFFYQTVDGFQFRSIDLLNKQTKKAVYIYSEATESYDNEGKKVDNNFKILNYFVERNQNLIEKMRLGTYASQRIFFNPLTGQITPPGKDIFKRENYVSKVENLGEDEITLPKISDTSDETLGDLPTRIITGILDIGTMEVSASKDLNADPIEYQSQTIMRYNNMFTQTLNMMIPSNTNLRAGDIIECLFPKISRGPAREYDNDQSGLYMIKELCHHFDAQNSYTSLKLVRDTFGIKE
jgi:hypothetical protein